MYKKSFLLIIPLIALIATGIFSENVYSDIIGLQGHYYDPTNGLTGPGGKVSDCDICHDFAGGYYNNPASGNLRWVKSSIKFCSISAGVACNVDGDCPTGETCGPSSRTVKFILLGGPPNDGTLADGPAPYDGACEVCHTKTRYHTYNGRKQDGTPVDSHYDGVVCTGCHPHFRQNMMNYFEPAFTGSQSHLTHWTDPKGPRIGSNNCTYCHDAVRFYLFADGKTFDQTLVCDPCHSKDGDFEGVNNPVYGAKSNWDGIYSAQGLLKEGKENWCAGCHDNGHSTVCYPPSSTNCVAAPNVMGDNVKYGYNISGHGRNSLDYIRCDDCHDTTALHTDGDARTYSASSSSPLKSYKAGYRLIMGLTIPRYQVYGQNTFRLCFDCHIFSEVYGPASNFRNDNTLTNLHDAHTGLMYAGIICWDSDWNSMTFPDKCYVGSECQDSAMSCTACHNVHGSPMTRSDDPLTYYPNPKMIRHGELISTPGSNPPDKVPALNFHWYTSESVPTTDLNSSRWGGLVAGGMDNQRIDINHVCWGCHPKGENRYYRVPTGLTQAVRVNGIWATDLNGFGKTIFAPGESIQYHVSYTVSGPRTSYNLKSNGTVKNMTGNAWSRTLPIISRTAKAGTYSETWGATTTMTIPTNATSGSSAKATVTVKMRYGPTGTIISQATKTGTFRIQ